MVGNKGLLLTAPFSSVGTKAMKPQTPRKKAKEAPARAAPEIPAGMRPLDLIADMLAGPEISLQECLVENISLKDRSLQSVVLETCVLKHVNFARCNLNGFRLKDVRLVECDFANANATGMKTQRVEFVIAG
jgi:uncharacterized protein YjbI with pentapeptide repeats